ncbi:MAG TPA: sugar ABC transporter permease [Actinomycetales bacterium]|jgi:multiple sugar transport system permease protein
MATSMTATGSRGGARAARPGGSGRRGRDGASAFGFLSLSLVGLLLFTVVPIVGSLVMAFFDWPVFGERTFVGLANFTELMSGDPVFRRVLLNTVLFVVAYLPLNIIVSLGLAAWIGPKIRGRGAYRFLFFLPAVTPMVANAIIWQLMLTPRGLIDAGWTGLTGSAAPNFLGSPGWAMAAVVVMSVWQGFGYNMLIFSAALDGLPDSLVEAATMDGAGPVRRFWSVVLPLLSPAMFFAVIMTLITSFQVFIQPYVLTGGGPGVSTQTLVGYLYSTGFEQFEMGSAAAIAWVLFAIIMLVTGLQFLGQRRWVHYDE